MEGMERKCARMLIEAKYRKIQTLLLWDVVLCLEGFYAPALDSFWAHMIGRGTSSHVRHQSLGHDVAALWAMCRTLAKVLFTIYNVYLMFLLLLSMVLLPTLQGRFTWRYVAADDGQSSALPAGHGKPDMYVGTAHRSTATRPRERGRAVAW